METHHEGYDVLLVRPDELPVGKALTNDDPHEQTVEVPTEDVSLARREGGDDLPKVDWKDLQTSVGADSRGRGCLKRLLCGHVGHVVSKTPSREKGSMGRLHCLPSALYK